MNWVRERVPALAGWIPFVALLTWMARSGDPNLLHVGTLIAIWTLWGTSMNVIWGYAGQFSMAQVGFGAVSAYTAAVLVDRYGWTTWPAVGLAVLAAVTASLVIGLVSLRLSGFYFSIMTLAFALLLLSFVRQLEIAGRSTGLSSSFRFGTVDVAGVRWDLDSRSGGFLVLCGALAALALGFVGRLERSRSGRALIAMREDPVLARSVGIRTSTHRLFAFVVSAVVAGIAGLCYAAYFRFLAPSFFVFSTLIVMIVQVVIGGRGQRFGPFIGAFAYIGLVEWLRFGGEYREGFFGVTLIAIVLFAPQGILGTGGKILRWLAAPRGASTPAGPNDTPFGDADVGDPRPVPL